MSKHKHKQPPEKSAIATASLTIVFEDNGQNFLEWDVDESGEVVDSRPFQGWVWKGVEVMNAATVKPGDDVIIRRKHGQAMRLIHRVQEVRR